MQVSASAAAAEASAACEPGAELEKSSSSSAAASAAAATVSEPGQQRQSLAAPVRGDSAAGGVAAGAALAGRAAAAAGAIDIVLAYPMHLKRQALLKARAWNARLEGIFRLLEQMRGMSSAAVAVGPVAQPIPINAGAAQHELAADSM